MLATGIINAVNKGLSLENVSADKEVNSDLFKKVVAEKRVFLLLFLIFLSFS